MHKYQVDGVIHFDMREGLQKAIQETIKTVLGPNIDTFVIAWISKDGDDAGVLVKVVSNPTTMSDEEAMMLLSSVEKNLF